jgi:hypothetical protein
MATIYEQLRESRVLIDDYLALEKMVRKYTLDGVLQALEIIKEVHTKWPTRIAQVSSDVSCVKPTSAPRLKIAGAAAKPVRPIEFD